jgi:hypothetical protein
LCNPHMQMSRARRPIGSAMRHDARPCSRSIYRSYLKSPWESPGGCGRRRAVAGLGCGLGAVGVLGVGESVHDSRWLLPLPTFGPGKGGGDAAARTMLSLKYSQGSGISKERGAAEGASTGASKRRGFLALAMRRGGLPGGKGEQCLPRSQKWGEGGPGVGLLDRLLWVRGKSIER